MITQIKPYHELPTFGHNTTDIRIAATLLCYGLSMTGYYRQKGSRQVFFVFADPEEDKKGAHGQVVLAFTNGECRVEPRAYHDWLKMLHKIIDNNSRTEEEK